MFLVAPQEVMSEKGEESAVGPKSQVKSPGKSITPSPNKKRLSMRLLSVEEEGEGASHAGGSAVSMEDGENARPPLPSLT